MEDTISPSVREGWAGPGRRDGVITPLNPEDDALHIEPGKRNQFEWWYFDAHLEGGYTVVAFFHAANPNPGIAGKTGVELTLLRPDGRKTQRFIEYDRSEFQASSDMPDVRIGKNYMKVDYSQGELPVYEIFLDEEELGFHLIYRSQVHGWKPGDGYSHFGGKGYFAWVVPFARAVVEGTVRDGNSTFSVTGVGYHDHNWLNFAFQRIIEYWMWGRVYSDNFTVSYAYIKCNKSVDYHIVKVLMLAKNQDVILSTGEYEFIPEHFEYDERTNHYYPKSLTIRNPQSFETVLKVQRVLEAQNMLDNFGALLRFAASKILRLQPKYFRLLSEFELKVNHGGVSAEESGTTLHEIVAFKPILKE
ncbi:MAG: hypothetical protein ACFFER_05050 [Candidatus Thorarchaeota archaeon]